MSDVKINNRLPIAETITLSLVFLLAIVGAGYYFVQISHLSVAPLASPLFWLVSLVAVVTLIMVLRKRGRDRGQLSVNTNQKTFQLNSSPSLPFSSLTYYKATLAAGTKRSPYSSMTITLGTDQHGQFSIIDADRFYFKPKGRTHHELEALNMLIAGSGLSDKDKESYANWEARAKMVLPQGNL